MLDQQVLAFFNNFLSNLFTFYQVATLQCPEVRGTACIVSARPPTDSTPDNSHLAVGYSTGDVVVFSIKDNQSIDPTVFDGKIAENYFDELEWHIWLIIHKTPGSCVASYFSK